MRKLIAVGEELQVYASSAFEARFIYHEIFNENCYGAVDLPPRPYVVDVGANIGMFAIFLKRRYPDAEISCFEPIPDTAALLRKNIELHGLSDVTVHELALGPRAEKDVSFLYFPMLPGNSTRYPDTKLESKAHMARNVAPEAAELLYQGREVTATVDRLAAHLPETRPVDLVKVDVEGAETDVLLGIDDDQWPRIRQVILEVADLDGRLGTVCEILRANGLEPIVQTPVGSAEENTYVVHALRPTAAELVG